MDNAELEAQQCPKSLERFVDYEKCTSLIDSLHDKLGSASDSVKAESEAEILVETFRRLIDTYQELPELLDSYLSELIQRLIVGLDDVNISDARYHTVFKFLYQLIKVTGFKTIAKRFPHDVNKLPLLIELLNREDPNDKKNWQTRYVLTVWLSIVILAPFDLVKFETDSTDSSISDKIYTLLTSNLANFDSSQHATSYCLAKFLSRPDIISSRDSYYVANFVDTAMTELSSVKMGIASSLDDIQLIGYLRTLSYMFKFMPRTEMKLYSETIVATILRLDLDKINRELVNHLIIKLIQRAGLSMLPVKMASWRYKRGCRSLGRLTFGKDGCSLAIKPASEQLNLNAPTGLNQDALKAESRYDDTKSKENLDVEEPTQEESESAGCIESILGTLFEALQNPQTRVRWSAAKGIARIASRLSRSRASEVTDMVLENFFHPVNSSDFSWHGGCLTLAEMARHGLIQEEKLERVTKLVGDAIIYEKLKGSMAVGAHVREAACYVFWALARTYEDNLLSGYVKSISLKLLCAMLFDREVHCRRAASATFQELLGRQGSFKEDEISLLTSLDYMSVGQRTLAYLELAPQVASKGTLYSHKFVEHLMDKKIGHSDIQIRRLASDSLATLMLHCDQEFIELSVVEPLVDKVQQDSDLNLKHGAILSLAKVIKSLVSLQFKFEQKLVDLVGNLSQICAKQLKNRVQAANFLEAIGIAITSAYAANFTYKGDSQVLQSWESSSMSALDSDNANLRDFGSDAIATLYSGFYKGDRRSQDRILTYLNKSLSSLNESTRCGALRALSKLGGSGDAFKLVTEASQGDIRTDAETPDLILMSLTSYISQPTHEKKEDIIFAQAKAEACDAFVNFLRRLDTGRLVLSSSLIRAGYDALLEKSEDYTFDKRGDIGVVVRRAAVKALVELTIDLIESGVKSIFLPDGAALGQNIVSRLLQQAVSYHNSTRELAASSLYKLLTFLASCEARAQEASDQSQPVPANKPSGSSLFELAHMKEILCLFEHFGVCQEGEQFNWRDESTPIFVALLGKQEYNLDIWIGLLPALGQISDLCSKQFRDALQGYLLGKGKFSTLPKALVKANVIADELAGLELEREQVFEALLDVLESSSNAAAVATTTTAATATTTNSIESSASLTRRRSIHAAGRLVNSTLIAIDYMLTEGLLAETSVEFQRRLVDYCWQTLSTSGNDVRRQTSVGRVLAAMFQFSDEQVQSKCLDYSRQLLASSNAKVRRYTAEQLYVALMSYQDELGPDRAAMIESSIKPELSK